MVSLIPRSDAMKSEINFPSENLPVDILPGKDCPKGEWSALINVKMKLLFPESSNESPKVNVALIWFGFGLGLGFGFGF